MKAYDLMEPIFIQTTTGFCMDFVYPETTAFWEIGCFCLLGCCATTESEAGDIQRKD